MSWWVWIVGSERVLDVEYVDAKGRRHVMQHPWRVPPVWVRAWRRVRSWLP